MPNVLKYVYCVVSMAVLTRAFRPFDQSLGQASKTITSPSPATEKFSVYHSNSNDKERNISKKFISTVDTHSSPILRPKSPLGFGYLEKPFESAKRYSYISELSKINSLPYSENSHGRAEKIMHVKRTLENVPDPAKISTIEPKYTERSITREPSDYLVRYSQNTHPSRQNSPVPYHGFPYMDNGMKTEDNLFDKQLRDNSQQLIRTPFQSSREDPIQTKYIHFHGRKPLIPSHISNLPSKSYSEKQFSSQKQFKVNPEEHLRSTSAFDKHVLSKSSYHSDPQISSRLLPFRLSSMHSSVDNSHNHNSGYSDSTSSEEPRNPIPDNHSSFQHFKAPQNDVRVIQLQKQSSPDDKGSVEFLKPYFHPSSLLEKHHSSSQLRIKEESNFSERPQILLPHAKQEKILTPSNSLVKNIAPNPNLPPYQSPPQEDLRNSRDFSHFVSEDSSKRMFPNFDRQTEKLVKSKHEPSDYFSSNVGRDNYPQVHLRTYDVPTISDYVNFHSNLHERPHESESFQSQEKLFFPVQTSQEHDTRSNLSPINLYNEPLDMHKEYTSAEEEDILAAKVKALLNPPENHSVEDAQHHSESAKNLPPASNTFSVDNERNVSPKHTTASDKDDGIVSLESDPEPESEEDTEDSKGVFGEEQHDGFLDMGAYTDKQGSFGWYADFPVGRGHDKVSYSSSK